MSDSGDAGWFDKDGNAGQEEGTEEQGAELPVDDDEQGAVMDEVPIEELHPPAAELKTEEPKKITTRQMVPKSDGTRRAPVWAKIPKGMKFPKGIDVLILRLRPEWTMYPGKGERQVILWQLTDGDQKLAISRAMGDSNRLGIEMTKQMIRAADGMQINWTGDPSAPGIDIDRFWHEIGQKGRSLLHRITNQMCIMSEDEHADFFEHCIAAVRTG
jgi:hypothetical protein